jgi:hypothetical protein
MMAIPNLFPEFKGITGPGKQAIRRRYVSDRMVELAEDGKLYITHLLNQYDVELLQQIGDVLLGISYDDSVSPMVQRVDAHGIPEELRDYKVKLRRVGDYKIEWKKGRERVDDRVFVGRGSASSKFKIAKYEDVTYFTDDDEIEVVAPMAWLALRQYGKYCRVAKSERQRQRLWRFEEVMPESAKPQPIVPGLKKRRISKGSFTADPATEATT